MEHPDITISHLRIADKYSLSPVSQPVELELEQKVGELEDRQNRSGRKLIKNAELPLRQGAVGRHTDSLNDFQLCTPPSRLKLKWLRDRRRPTRSKRFSAGLLILNTSDIATVGSRRG